MVLIKGCLQEGRYKATLIDTEAYLLTCMRYIELNPIRADMVEHPADYPWSSYRHNAQGDQDPLITSHSLYHRLGSNNQDRCREYRELFRLVIDDKTVADIREATNKAWVLGNDRFKEKIKAYCDRRLEPKPRGGDRKSEEYRNNGKINRV